jgi:hypothetical protein
MNKEGTVGQRKHVTLTIPQQLEIIRRLYSGRSRREVMASYSGESSTIYDIKKRYDKLRSFVTLTTNVNGLLK